jgi:hypothetical protein
VLDDDKPTPSRPLPLSLSVQIRVQGDDHGAASVRRRANGREGVGLSSSSTALFEASTGWANTAMELKPVRASEVGRVETRREGLSHLATCVFCHRVITQERVSAPAFPRCAAWAARRAHCDGA